MRQRRSRPGGRRALSISAWVLKLVSPTPTRAEDAAVECVDDGELAWKLVARSARLKALPDVVTWLSLAGVLTWSILGSLRLSAASYGAIMAYLLTLLAMLCYWSLGLTLCRDLARSHELSDILLIPEAGDSWLKAWTRLFLAASAVIPACLFWLPAAVVFASQNHWRLGGMRSVLGEAWWYLFVLASVLMAISWASWWGILAGGYWRLLAAEAVLFYPTLALLIGLEALPRIQGAIELLVTSSWGYFWFAAVNLALGILARGRVARDFSARMCRKYFA